MDLHDRHFAALMQCCPLLKDEVKYNSHILRTLGLKRIRNKNKCCFFKLNSPSMLSNGLLVCLAGILFSTLVFGPACGFILGSVCTKVYVDAVFIDTSELLVTVIYHNKN